MKREPITDQSHPFWVQGYYVPEKHNGELATETRHASESSRDFELNALKSRDDIGKVFYGKLT